MAKMTRSRVVEPEEVDDSQMEDFEREFDEPEDVVDTPPARKRMTRPAGPVSSGWGAPTQKRETVKAPYLSLDRKTKKIIKLLDEEPAVRFKQHYIKPLNKFFTCIEVYEGKDSPNNVECPLCEAGHKAALKFVMNVVEMSEPDEVKTWTFGPEVAGHLQSLGEENITSPINKPSVYLKVYQVKGANDRISNKVEALKARDLQEDYGLEPLNEDEIDTLCQSLYGEETIWITSEDRLREAAKSV
jgi:hypothetical protein